MCGEAALTFGGHRPSGGPGLETGLGQVLHRNFGAFTEISAQSMSCAGGALKFSAFGAITK